MLRKAREINDLDVKILTDTLEIIKNVSQHPCNRLARKVKQMNEVADKILFTKTVLQHPQDRLSRKVQELNSEISFIKKVPLQPRDSCTQKVNEWKETVEETLFVQKVTSYRRDRLERKVKQLNKMVDKILIARIIPTKKNEKTLHLWGRKKLKEQKLAASNSDALVFKFQFDPQEISDKSLIFDLKKTNKEKILDRLIEKNKNNDKFYIEHRRGTTLSE